MEGNDFENEAGKRDDAELEPEDEAPHDKEHPVAEESFEDVPLVMDLPRTDHVHDLHQCEQVEEEGKVLGVATREMQVLLAIATNRLCNFLEVLLGHLGVGVLTRVSTVL